ncbi:unnamed protein product [Choristocarpus tenellus]
MGWFQKSLVLTFAVFYVVLICLVLLAWSFRIPRRRSHSSTVSWRTLNFAPELQERSPLEQWQESLKLFLENMRDRSAWESGGSGRRVGGVVIGTAPQDLCGVRYEGNSFVQERVGKSRLCLPVSEGYY